MIRLVVAVSTDSTIFAVIALFLLFDRKNASPGDFWALNSTEIFKIGQKFKVWEHTGVPTLKIKFTLLAGFQITRVLRAR